MLFGVIWYHLVSFCVVWCFVLFSVIWCHLAFGVIWCDLVLFSDILYHVVSFYVI